MDVFEYIQDDLNSEPRHDCEALAFAANEVAYLYQSSTNPRQVIEFMLANKPIPTLATHSYGFHTANGREIINSLQHKYYEYTS